MDLQEMSRKISAAEKKKAQLEVIDEQNKSEAAALKADLEKAGVTDTDIDDKIKDLEFKLTAGINKIDAIVGAPAEEFV